MLTGSSAVITTFVLSALVAIILTLAIMRRNPAAVTEENVVIAVFAMGALAFMALFISLIGIILYQLGQILFT